ncbi:hypothetical protein OESDEN_21531 [Oesophagostomum dentatum]|uniref:Uncharacterized protein n=1 Tax=Oesophagostomum dentatum TaxID=61180 RepID=A0A0B1S0G8_OESDE|nr:hypothetical protein OESDEN_21531 [Oesophagostomum dentatum]
MNRVQSRNTRAGKSTNDPHMRSQLPTQRIAR